MNSNLAKLRALCFWAPVVISLFTEVSTVPWERCQTVTHLLYKSSATCSSTIVLYNLEVPFFTVSLLNLHWVHRAGSLVPTLAWTFHTPSKSSAEPVCLSFFLIYCSSVRSWKETCQFLLCAAQWPSEDTLATEEKSTEPGPCLARSHTAWWSALPNAKGQTEYCLPFYSSQLAWL